MRIRASLTLKNDKMLAARDKASLTQAALAQLVGGETAFVGALESLDYSWLTMRGGAPHKKRLRMVADIAQILRLAVEDVAPEELIGSKIASRADKTLECDAESLIGLSADARRLAVGPDQDALEVDDARERLDALLPRLAERPRRILLARMQGQTLAQIAAREGVCPARINKIEDGAVAKLQKWASVSGRDS